MAIQARNAANYSGGVIPLRPDAGCRYSPNFGTTGACYCCAVREAGRELHPRRCFASVAFGVTLHQGPADPRRTARAGNLILVPFV